MAEVMASCEKCGAFLPACAHVMANGLVSLNPDPQLKHWEESQGCRGHYGMMHVSHLQQAADMAKSVITARKEAKKSAWRRLREWFLGPFYRWQMGRYLDRLDE
jgi:hypothetical protein